MAELSICIPARNEIFLQETIDSILANMRGDTEIIVVLDGYWPVKPIPDHKRVTILHYTESVGQRAATNAAVRLSRAKWVMKLDAHCALAEGFDVQLMKDIEPGMTMVPRLYNLHAFDWVCPSCGLRKYQCPTPARCEVLGGDGNVVGGCGATGLQREMIWKPRLNRMTDFMRFDRELRFKYWHKFGNRPEAKPEIAPTMSTLGACWMVSRDMYRRLNLCDEKFGSWGQQGTEIACKTWLSGGRLMTNKRTWYSHMFRTQGGDFGFPFPLSGKQVDHARKYSRELFLENRWEKAIHPLSWLIDEFSPVPDWEGA